jgi:TPR repeat protein
MKTMIDLHGCSVKEAKELLEKHFSKFKENNITEFYIITGRGNHIASNGNRGVLKKILPKLLKPYCQEISQVDKETGSYKITLKNYEASIYEDMKQLLILTTGTAVENEQAAYLKTLEQQAKNDSIAALILLGSFHLTGLVPGYNNKAQGIQLLSRAKQLGSLEACVQLGLVFLEGLLVEKDYKKALENLQYAADKGFAVGQTLLAKCYLHGQGVKQNDKQAVYWLERAAEQGDGAALHTLGHSYLVGEFTEVNETLGVKFLTLVALQGSADAKVHLARCYATGYGVIQDDAMALSLYEQAAKHNNVFALYQAGQYYTEGRTTNIDYKKAFKYFMRAAELGDADSQAKLGVAYLFAKGTEKDITQGLGWIQKAVAQKNPSGYYTMSIAYSMGLGVKKDLQEEYKFLELAANAGLVNAQYDLGLKLIADEKTSENRQAGLSWIEKAAKQDYEEAIAFLKKPVAKPIKVKADNFTSNSLRLYLSKAAQIEQQLKSKPPLLSEDNYSLKNKTRINDTTLILLLKEKTKLPFFGVRDEEFKVDAALEINSISDQTKAIQLQRVLKGHGRFFNVEQKKKVFVLEGINITDENPMLIRNIQRHVQVLR